MRCSGSVWYSCSMVLVLSGRSRVQVLNNTNFFWFFLDFLETINRGRLNEVVSKPVSENLSYSGGDDAFDPSAPSAENLFMVNLNP